MLVRSRSKPVFVAVGLVAALAFAACDSGEVTQEDYRAATGEVCAKYQKVVEADQARVDRLAAESSENPGPFVEAVRKFQRNWDEFAAALKAVERPPDDRRQLASFFSSVSRLQDRIVDLSRQVDQLPGLLAELDAVQQSQDAAEAEALVARAQVLQFQIEQTEAGFEEAIGEVERFIDRYPGLADCR